jgi:hypothetical protein
VRIPFGLKIGWTIWVAVWMPIYWRQYNPENFLQFCDMGNFLVMAALWLESSLLFSITATGLLLFQTLYSIDLLGALISGCHWIGGTEYMFDSQIPLFVRLLSLFHLVMPPLLLWALWKLSYDKRGWIAQTVLTWVVVPFCYFWHPERDVNWVRGWGFREQHMVPAVVYVSAYLVLVPLLVYYPTHLVLQAWVCRRNNSQPKLTV